MGAAVDGEQLGDVDVRIALRRAQPGMTEELLNRAKIGAALQQMGCERVPERVRADPGSRAGRRDMAANQPIDASRRETAAAIVHKQRIAPTPVEAAP
jgi:hypothetical protein